MTLPGDDNYEEEATDALTPGVEGVETPSQAPAQEDKNELESTEPHAQPAADQSSWRSWYRQLQPLLGYLPTGVHEEDTDRDGLLSYSVEVHAAVIGVSVGVAAMMGGDMQLVMALVSIALGVGRVQQQFSDKVKSQLIKEPWYALAGAAIGYLAMHIAQTGQLPH